MNINRLLCVLIPVCICHTLTLAAPEVPVTNTDPFIALDLEKQTWMTEEDDARFTREPNTFSWISDIEHVIDEVTKDIYLADGDPKLYMCGDTIPAGKLFELFPYHYYDKEEEESLGKKINYSLIIKNPGEKDVTIEITGMGTTTTWDHYKTWEGALRGDNKQTLRLKPGEIHTLWNEIGLEGGLPWSGIILGKSDGDIWVCDYCYLSDKDPGVAEAKGQPDLTWAPYLLASFTRGSAPWNAAAIDLFHKKRDAENRISLSTIDNGVYSFAFAYSPGGPITNLCEYKAVQPTFLLDEFVAKDPDSGYSHKFFGGNYPIMYKFKIPMVNDGKEAKTVRFYLASNDKFKVDTIAGAWIADRMLWRRIPMIGKNEHWKILTTTVKPGTSETLDFIVVPLGSRWGGLIGSLEIASEETKK